MRRVKPEPGLVAKAVAALLAVALQVLAFGALNRDGPWHRYDDEPYLIVDILPDASGPPVAAMPQEITDDALVRPEIPLPPPPDYEYSTAITAPGLEARTQGGTGPSSAALPLRARPEAAPDVPPLEYVEPPRPEYPALSRRQKEQGTTWLRVLVDAAGIPASAEIVRSSGFARLDRAALQAMSRARFRPHVEDGRPSPAYVVVPIAFRLDD